MQRTWAVAPVAAVAVLAAQLAIPVPGLPSAPPADLSTSRSMEVALAAVEQAVSWQCDLPHRTAAQRTATQRALRSNDPTPTFVKSAAPAAGPNPRPIPGFGGDPGQNPRVKVNGGFPGAGGADVYQVPLRAGEVFSATVRGSGGTLEVRDPKGVLVEGSSVDRSGIYPPASPLLGGGNATVDHVASVTGMHTITVRPSKSDSPGSSGGAAPGGAAPSGAAAGGAAAGDEPAGTEPDPAQVPVAGSAAAPSNAAVDAGTRVLPPVALEAPEPSTAPTPSKPAPSKPAPSKPAPSKPAPSKPAPIGAADPDSGEKNAKKKSAKNPEPAAGPAAVAPSEIAAPPDAPQADDPRAYQVDLGIFRPVRASAQKIVLEFGGAAIDTRKFGLETANNDVKLSPLSTFLPRFGLTAADQPELTKRIVGTVRENLSAAIGGGAVDVSAAETPGGSTFGKPGVSRVVIGGSSTEAGISTVGISESVDPGNFAQEETALVLLDRLSGPGNETVSLGHYLPGVVDRGRRIEFVGRALGNIATHEAGHFLGSWHTDTATRKHDLMAPGDVIGAFGFGPDKLGGTPDDVRSKFGQDQFAPSEGFTGTEDTSNRTLVGLRGMPSPG